MNIPYKRGHTIVELLVYMGILSILLVTLTNLFSLIVNLRLEAEGMSAVEQDGDFLLSRLFYDISRADSITVPADNGDTTSTLQLVIGGVTHTYATASGQLQITNDNGTDNLNGVDTTVSNISFQRIGNGGGQSTVNVAFTLTSVAVQIQGPETKSFSTTVGIRK